jgi:hypothetical protein
MLTLASPTCEDNVSTDNRLQVDREALQVITEDLTSESLTRRNLDAFEYRAVEKLRDYADYLNILYDENLDEAFHHQAGVNIKDLFSGCSAPENPLPAGIDPGAYSSFRFITGSVDIIVPLEKKAEETYAGSMQFSLKILGITGSDTTDLYTSIHQTGMMLQKRLKDFGEDSMLVWEVLLSEEK